MTYLLISEAGLIATVSGLHDFRARVITQRTPTLQKFLDEGFTEDLDALRIELEYVQVEDASLVDTLESLRSASVLATETLTITNGEGDEEAWLLVK